ncbi:MAG: hypothetical protein H6741_15140 [Alphaproteobacteria bacterium]|nr:hypothetical protein [Alphaproteobacteria bacterium]
MDRRETPQGLEALRFMLGRWRIEGEQRGQPVRGRAEVRLGVGGSFLEYRETIFSGSGEPDYEDLCVYGFSTETFDLFVHHFSAPDHVAFHPVLPIKSGAFNWVPKDMSGPWVRLVPGEPWRVEVWWLDADAPDLCLRFLPDSPA